MSKDVSPTMQALVERMKTCDQKIYRHPGGYWAHKDWQYNNGPWFGTSTVQALVSRGIAEYSKWQEGKGGRFPIEATLNPKAVATPARTTGAHSGGNRGIRCAGEATDTDRGDIGFANAVANGRSVGTSSVGGDSVPSDRGKTCDSAERRSPGSYISALSPDESNRCHSEE